MPRAWAVVVAGGSGRRFGELKQFATLGGRPVVEWSVAVARTGTDGVVVVVPSSSTDRTFGADLVAVGGPTRSASVRAGLSVLPPDVDIVVVHDAARPLAGPPLFGAVLAALGDPSVDGAVTAVEVTDTVKRVTGRPPHVVETLDRSSLVSVQTPQAFRVAALRRAHAGSDEATDDAALVEAAGGTVRIVPGDPRNIKITTPADLALASRLLEDS